MSFKDNLQKVRYKQGDSWFDRSQRGVEDLDDLRQHRGFQYLMDIYDGNLRALWMQWCVCPDM